MKKSLFLIVPLLLGATSCQFGIANNNNNGGNSNVNSVPTLDDVLSGSYEESEISWPAISENEKPMKIWVGAESVDFYTEKMGEFEASFEEKYGVNFPKWEVEKIDTGTSADVFLQDTAAGADIFVCAHDNLGKLTAGSSVIAPITDIGLLTQIATDNSQGFKDIIINEVQGTKYTFGVPFIAQALVYYYNSSIVSPEQVGTWEGIMEACATKGANVRATSILGADGYNNSFLTLARQVLDDGSTTTSVKIYEGGVQDACYFSGDDTISVMRWGQDFFSNPNGCDWPSSSGWEIELKDGHSAGLIGGAWNFAAAQTALGSNFAVAPLPRFTITADQAYGSIKAGTVFQSGTFADCKVLVMKKGSVYADYLQPVMKFLSSKEIQEQSFERCANLPAYKNAADEFESLKATDANAQTAAAQIKMFDYGIPQPFGVKTKYNTYYYSKSGPDYLKAILDDKNLKEADRKFTTAEAIKAELEAICHIWKKGKRPE